MSEIPEDLKYIQSHEWVRIEDGIATVGITDHAQEELGDIVFVELPETGDSLNVDDACGVVESVKAASDLFSPIAGDVIDNNAALIDEPELINSSPYSEGWLFKVRLDEDCNLDDLLTAVQYAEMLAEEE